MAKDLKPVDDSIQARLLRMQEDLKNGLVSAKAFNDPEIYAIELRKIFARCWVFIGHVSEIPNPGDYYVRRIGEDPFIFVRGEDNEIRVLFNSCRHRGSVICRTDAGNTSHFRCPYHAWTYKNDGSLIGVPSRQAGYQELDMSQWNLFRAPRVETYCGMVFANLDPDAPTFSDYLGAFKWYLDIQFNLTDAGVEVIGEPHRWWVEADWKSGAENFCGDSAHTQMTHRSLLQIGLADKAGAGSPGQEAHGLHINECDGHAISIRWYNPGIENFWGYPKEIYSEFRPGPLSEPQFDLARRAVVHDGTVFPNFSFIHFAAKEDLDKPAAGFLSVRVWQPRGPGQMEIWNWILAPKEASDEYKERAYRAGMSSFSPSGHFEQDDVTVWSGIARSASSVYAELNNVKFNYQMGMPGMAPAVPLADWPGPGTAWASNAGESGLRTFHRRWAQQMCSS
ncbi:MAG: Rieske 2Fe-2S domain-containing protein [Actinobacteria bacterium]|nr:Rieske 2Fe-2S domain-containing protein [Actinomycetota bacterium]